MFGLRPIPLKNLAELSRRLAIALGAGIDLRRALETEADRAGGFARGRLSAVRDAVREGQSLADALAAAGGYFPPLFRKMVELGEKTGHLPDVLGRLADHYEGQMQLRRMFLSAIAWPLAELAIAVVVVGLLIWIVGLIGESTGTTIDPLGFGLTGTRGLAVYVAVVVSAAVAVVLMVQAARRGLFWIRPVQLAAMRLPVIGPCLKAIALARMTWALQLTLNTELDVREAMRLGVETSLNPRFAGKADRIERALSGGSTVTEAVETAGAFPPDFVAAVGIGEHTGSLPESMALLSRQYQEQARAALATLTRLAGTAVWLVIAGLILFLIFRLASFYLGAYQDALSM